MRTETVGGDRRDGPSPPLPISHQKLAITLCRALRHGIMAKTTMTGEDGRG